MPAEIRVGAADLFFTPPGSTIEVYLGLIDTDGVKVSYATTKYDTKSAQYGDTPIESTVVGETATVTANLLDTSLVNISNVLSTVTVERTGTEITAVTFGGNLGMKLSTKAGRLRVHPIAAGMETTSDIILYKAANSKGFELTYNNSKDSIIPVEFMAMPDFTRPPGDQLGRIGQSKEYTEVYLRLVSMPISPSNPTISIGGNVDFTANAIYEDGSTQDITTQCTWISSATNIATIEIVSGKAKATALAIGTTVIRAQYGNVSNSTILTVEA